MNADKIATIDWLEPGNGQHYRFCPACAKDTVDILGYVDLKQLRPGLADRVPPIPVARCRFCDTYTTISACNEKFQGAATNALNFHLSLEKRNREAGRHLLNQLNNYSRTIRRILEIGCGPGFLLDEARKKGLHVVGYDIDEQAVEYGRRTFGIDLRSELWCSAKNEHFDALLCISCLEHLEDPESMVENIARSVASNDAVAVLSVPIYPEGSIYPYLNDVKSEDHFNIFRLVPWHTIHFSDFGFRALVGRHRAYNYISITTPLWGGGMMRFERGESAQRLGRRLSLLWKALIKRFRYAPDKKDF